MSIAKQQIITIVFYDSVNEPYMKPIIITGFMSITLHLPHNIYVRSRSIYEFSNCNFRSYMPSSLEECIRWFWMRIVWIMKTEKTKINRLHVGSTSENKKQKNTKLHSWPYLRYKSYFLTFHVVTNIYVIYPLESWKLYLFFSLSSLWSL